MHEPTKSKTLTRTRALLFLEFTDQAQGKANIVVSESAVRRRELRYSGYPWDLRADSSDFSATKLQKQKIPAPPASRLLRPAWEQPLVPRSMRCLLSMGVGEVGFLARIPVGNMEGKRRSAEHRKVVCETG